MLFSFYDVHWDFTDKVDFYNDLALEWDYLDTSILLNNNMGLFKLNKPEDSFNLHSFYNLYQFSIPNTKMYYPEPFIATATFLHYDIWFVHISIYQYWLWFFFIFIIVFFVICFISTIRWCNVYVNPQRETRGVSRSKCGDLITAVVPVSWAGSIIVHESNDAIDYYDGFGTIEMAIGIRAYQWGWEYYYPKDADIYNTRRSNYSLYVGKSLNYYHQDKEKNFRKIYFNFLKKKDYMSSNILPLVLLLSNSSGNDDLKFWHFKHFGFSKLKLRFAFMNAFKSGYLNFDYRFKPSSLIKSNYNDSLVKFNAETSVLYAPVFSKREYSLLSTNSIFNNSLNFSNLNNLRFFFQNSTNSHDLDNSCADDLIYDLAVNFKFMQKNTVNFSNLYNLYNSKPGTQGSIWNHIFFAVILSRASVNFMYSNVDKTILAGLNYFNRELTSNILNSNYGLNFSDSLFDKNYLESNYINNSSFFNVSFKKSLSDNDVSSFFDDGEDSVGDYVKLMEALFVLSSEPAGNKSSVFQSVDCSTLSKFNPSKVFRLNKLIALDSYSLGRNSNLNNTLKKNFLVRSNNSGFVKLSEELFFFNYFYKWPSFYMFCDFDFKREIKSELLDNLDFNKNWEGYSFYKNLNGGNCGYLTKKSFSYKEDYCFTSSSNYTNIQFENLPRLLFNYLESNEVISSSLDQSVLKLKKNESLFDLLGFNQINNSSLFINYLHESDLIGEMDEDFATSFKSNSGNYKTDVSSPISLSDKELSEHLIVFYNSMFYIQGGFSLTYSDIYNYNLFAEYVKTVCSITGLGLNNNSKVLFPSELSMSNSLSNSPIKSYKSITSYYKAFWKIYRNSYDESRSTYNWGYFSTSYNNIPLLTAPNFSYKTSLDKTSSLYFKSHLFYERFLNNTNFSRIIDSNLTNFFTYDFPFELGTDMESTKYVWIDGLLKSTLKVVKYVDINNSNFNGLYKFNNKQDFKLGINKEINDFENYLYRLRYSRKSGKLEFINNFYMESWFRYSNKSSPYFINEDFFSRELLSFSNLNNYNFSHNHGLSNNLNSSFLTSTRGYWESYCNETIYGFYKNKLMDVLSNRERLVKRLYSYSYNNEIPVLPESYTVSYNNTIFRELEESTKFYNHVNLDNYSYISRKTSFDDYSFIEDLGKTNKSLGLFINSKSKSNSLLNKYNYKINQYHPMRKNISNMVRLHADGSVSMPIETRLQILAFSKDIIHSWSVPSAGVKIDCIPGFSSHRVLTFFLSGIYWGQCMEICGRFHHWMPIVVYFMKRDLFILWCTHFLSLNKLKDGTYADESSSKDYTDSSYKHVYNLKSWSYEL